MDIQHRNTMVAEVNGLNMRRKLFGFTLIEMMLVLVIMGVIISLIANFTTQRMDQFRREKAALQIQQIENAALAFYTQYGRWPLWQKPSYPGGCYDGTGNVNVNNLTQTENELGDAGLIYNSFSGGSRVTIPPYAGGVYYSWCDSVGNFNVALLNLPKQTDAIIIAGMLPTGKTVTQVPPDDALNPKNTNHANDSNVTTNSAIVLSTIQTPGQNLNNARSINFAGLYRNQACVPVPSCPANMTPQIYVVPASVQVPTYPISSFTAYATGPGTNPAGCNPGALPTPNVDVTPPDCTATVTATPPTSSGSPTGQYWRACLQVYIPEGDMLVTKAGLSGEQAVVAMTRCVPKAEPAGTQFVVQRNWPGNSYYYPNPIP